MGFIGLIGFGIKWVTRRGQGEEVRTSEVARGCSVPMVRYVSCTSTKSAPDGDLGAALELRSSIISALSPGE